MFQGMEMENFINTQNVQNQNVIACKDAPKCEKYKETLELLRHISFVDCSGHDILMKKC